MVQTIAPFLIIFIFKAKLINNLKLLLLLLSSFNYEINGFSKCINKKNYRLTCILMITLTKPLLILLDFIIYIIEI